jgi:hypothetical protein
MIMWPLPVTASAEGAQLNVPPFPATASAEGRQFNGAPFPATASAEGAQLNVPPSPRERAGVRGPRPWKKPLTLSQRERRKKVSVKLNLTVY